MLRINSISVILSLRFCFLSPLKRLYSPAVIPDNNSKTFKPQAEKAVVYDISVFRSVEKVAFLEFGGG